MVLTILSVIADVVTIASFILAIYIYLHGNRK